MHFYMHSNENVGLIGVHTQKAGEYAETEKVTGYFTGMEKRGMQNRYMTKTEKDTGHFTSMKMQENMQNSYTIAAEKTNSQRAKNWMDWIEIINLTENENVLIDFILFVMQRQVSGGKQNSTVILKFVHIVIFFSEWVGQRNEKAEAE